VETTITQKELHALTVSAFDQEEENGRFMERLIASDITFLQNLEIATVTVNGHNPLDDDMTGYPPPPQSGASGTQQQENGASSGTSLTVWQIAVIAGAGAFGVVLCLALTCICCMKVDDEMLNRNHSRDTKDGNSSKAKLTVTTNSTSRNDGSDKNDDNCELSSKSPSPVRSITSQDSSIFTYNPKSVKSAVTGTYSASGSTYFTSNTGLEMDLAAWQSSTQLAHHTSSNNTNTATVNPQHASFGDISAIEPTRNKKDLSLIQEEVESNAGSAASTPSRAGAPTTTNTVITESALNDLVHMERGTLLTQKTKGKGDGDDDDEDNDSEEDSTLFVPKCSSSGSDPSHHPTTNVNNHGSRPSSSRSSSSSNPNGRRSNTTNNNNKTNNGARLSLSSQHVMDELQELSHQIDAYRTQQY